MSSDPSRPLPFEGGDPSTEQPYLAEVLAEIDEEVRRRRRSGDLPRRMEQELDGLFLRYSPMSSRDGSIDEALGVVESASYIDPVVPVASSKSGGALVKRTIRKASLWYVGWLTDQINQFTAAATRTLRVLDDRLGTVQRQLDLQRTPPAPVIETDWAHGPSAWWVDIVLARLAGRPGRFLHAAAADGWLVRRLRSAGLDGYGVEPREGRINGAEIEELDLREEPVLDHLGSVAPDALAALVLTGVVDAMTAAERSTLLELVAQKLGPGGQLVIHSLSPGAWASEEVPVEADAAAGQPLRPRTWAALLERSGFSAEVVHGPEGLDYLVVAGAEGDPHPGHSG